MNMWVAYFMSDSGMLVFKGYLCMPETPKNNNNIYVAIIKISYMMTNNYIS